MDKPTKPTDLMPRSFGGIKRNFSETLQTNGFEPNVPAIYAGGNVNYQLNATGKELEYCEKIVDFINELPIGKTISTDANNKLVYIDASDSGKANISLDNLDIDGKKRLALKGYVNTDTYSENEFVVVESESYIEIYRSLQDNNIGHSTQDTEWWEKSSLVSWGAINGDINKQENLINLLNNKADLDLNNLTVDGNAKFQYKPFSINNGSVDENGNNTTLFYLNDTTYVLKREYPNYKPTSNNDEVSGIVTTPVSGWGNPSAAYKILAGYLSFNNNISITEVEFPNPIEITSVKTVTNNYWGMRIVEISAFDETIEDYVVVISGSYTNVNTTTKTFNASQAVKTRKLKFRLRGGTFTGDGITYYNKLVSMEINGIEYITLTGGTNLINTPCTITTADGRTKKFIDQTFLTMSDVEDGTYKIFKDITNGDLKFFNGLIAIQQNEPSSGILFWLDNSQRPYKFFKKDEETETYKPENDLVYLGNVTIIDGAIAAIENVKFNLISKTKPILDISPGKKVVMTWNTTFQLPCDAAIVWSAYSSSASNDGIVSYSADMTEWSVYAQHDSGYYADVGTVLPKGTYIKTSGGSSYQSVGYVPTKEGEQNDLF